MPDDITPSQDSEVTQTSTENSQGEVNQQAGDTSSGGNPAWAPFREALGDSFAKVEPLLKEQDLSIQKRFEQYKPYENLVKQGTKPEDINVALSIADQLRTPEGAQQLFGQLKGYLEAQGLTPAEASAAASEATGQPDPEDDPDYEENDPRIDEVYSYVQQQQREQAIGEANTFLDTQLKRVTEVHHLNDVEKNELLSRANAQLISTGRSLTPQDFDTIAQGLVSYKQSILTQPRPSDSAPSVVPTAGGGVPTGAAGQKSMGQLSSKESQALVADLLRKGQQPT